MVGRGRHFREQPRFLYDLNTSSVCHKYVFVHKNLTFLTLVADFDSFCKNESKR